MYIILLGEGCNISQIVRSYNLDSLRECSIFEWFLSAYFSDVNFILNKVAQGEDLLVTHGEHIHDLYMDSTRIRSRHYNEAVLSDKLKRRVARFLEQVKSDDTILFIREDKDVITTRQDIVEFKKIITQINPLCKYKILLITPHHIQNIEIIDNIDNLYQKNNHNLKDNILNYINEFTY